MAFHRGRAEQFIKQGKFREFFFEELGWDEAEDTPFELIIEQTAYPFAPIAQKKGFTILLCRYSGLPADKIRRRLETEIAKRIREHIVVYSTPSYQNQIWQWTRREPGLPLRIHEVIYNPPHQREKFLQRLEGLFFTLEEESTLSLVEVTGRVRAAFDMERATKKFYDHFKRERDQFQKFLQGIPATAVEAQRWYVSVMLNRLMFIYFIQRKQFLNSDIDYLRTKLQECQQKLGKDHYYRDFLKPLFFVGFAQRPQQRPATKIALGKVPYLNGGIFEEHEIEREYGEDLDIPDAAFERLFQFFNGYDWHLDDRPLKNDKEINPDVLGYIFEKYINQKEMGAYYTKEDITEYISKNTIIPYLLDTIYRNCKVAFDDTPSVWDYLQNDPERYIYPAVMHGVGLALPNEVEKGITNISAREVWNTAAPNDYRLPTEIWREVIARRQRYNDLRHRIESGEIRTANDLITYNLDSRQFIQDVIERCEGVDLLRAFWKALSAITILDPTCGSGAFLFAALNILQPLYEACLDRMIAFVEELPADAPAKRLEDFRKVKEDIARHPNREYYILKQIVVNNLYGVDIMPEAVEIAKLRLFLKLIAQVETSTQIEPLPDIDFNIRAGNTLVGFATAKEAELATQRQGIQGKLQMEEESSAFHQIQEGAEAAARLFKQFRRLQADPENDIEDTVWAKQSLRARLKQLDDELNVYLAWQYGIRHPEGKDFALWKKNHQPFHWFVDFYEIMHGGGFDVIIGNPPYLNYGKVEYSPLNFDTSKCPDIYAWIMERSIHVLSKNGRVGLIVPLSLCFSENFLICRTLLLDTLGSNWFSAFGRIPSALFNFDVRVRNTVYIGHKSDKSAFPHSSRLYRWYKEERPVLFENIMYSKFAPRLWTTLPRIGDSSLTYFYEHLRERFSKTIENFVSPRPTKFVLYYKKTAYNWLVFCKDLPPCYDNRGRSIPQTKFGSINFLDKETMDLAFLLLNGKMVYLYWGIIGDDFDLTKWMFLTFPFDFSKLTSQYKEALLKYVSPLQKAMENAVSFKRNAGKRVGTYNLSKCRHITDITDELFLKYLGVEDCWEDINIGYGRLARTFVEEEG